MSVYFGPLFAFFPLHCHLSLPVPSLPNPAALTKAEPIPRFAQVHILGRFVGVGPPIGPNQGPEQLQGERTMRMREYPRPK